MVKLSMEILISNIWLALGLVIFSLGIYFFIGHLIFLLQKYISSPNNALLRTLTSSHIREKDIGDLIHRGANPNFDNGLPLLIAIRMHTKEKILKALIANGANINFIYPNGSSPLFHAVIVENIPAFRVLATQGADINYKIKDGSDLLLCAIASKRYPMARILINEYGFSVDSHNNDGTTALMAACQCCGMNYFFVKELLAKPQDLSATDNHGKTYKDYMDTNLYLKIYQYLKLI